ncbi:hypothetical protein ACAW74_22810 [Fibrella sp. WM1]|uniref:hypothetical protein n=1 Tax=Fibrella musci TaxID=3242485 RepID=UPI0035204891
MLFVVIGCSCVGKNSIMDILEKEYSFSILNKVSTRNSRVGEHNNVTLSIENFKKISSEGKLLFENNFYSNYYAYFREDILVATKNIVDFYMMDFGIENISQLDFLNNTYKIVVIPENVEFLHHTIAKSGRQDRLNEIIYNYNEYYADLEEGFYPESKTLIIKNHLNKVQYTVNKMINYLKEFTKINPVLKKE